MHILVLADIYHENTIGELTVTCEQKFFLRSQ